MTPGLHDHRRKGEVLATADDKGAHPRLVAEQALEDLQDVREAYRAIELLVDQAPDPGNVGPTLGPLLRNLGIRFDGELQRAQAAAQLPQCPGCCTSRCACLRA